MKQVRALAFVDAVPIDGRGKRSNQTVLRLSKRDYFCARQHAASVLE